MKIRRIICAALCLLFLTPLCTAAADAESAGEKVTYLNLDDGQKLNYNKVKSTLAQYPDLEKVDMFSVPVNRQQIEELVALYPDIEFGWTIPCIFPAISRTKLRTSRCCDTASSSKRWISGTTRWTIFPG